MKTKIQVILLFLMMVGFGVMSRFTFAAYDVGCKVCSGGSCVSSGSSCNSDFNECSVNCDCRDCSVPTPTPAPVTCTPTTFCSGLNLCTRNSDCDVNCSTCSYQCTASACVPQMFCEDAGCCDNGVQKFVICFTNPITKDPVWSGCYDSSDCSASGNCVPQSSTCGGDLACPDNQTSHIDTCGGLACGDYCGAPPTGGCSPTNPLAPALAIPANGVIFSAPSGVASAAFGWNATSSWGTECLGSIRGYQVCIGSSPTDPCSGGTKTVVSNTNLTPPTSKTIDVTPGIKYWSVQSINRDNLFSSKSEIRNICVEGFDENSSTYVGEWSSCDANHTRTRTCTEDCGTDDCAAFVAAGGTAEYCTGVISGALFDASDWSFCPGDITTNPAAYGDILIANRSFSMTGPYTLPAWPPSSDGEVQTVSTNGSGLYSVTAFSPGVYNYDFSALEGTFTDVNNPKLMCTGFPTATLLGSDPSCLTQPCTPASVGNSFGFWRVYGGWWQVVGGSVYAKNGITSSIPASISPSTDQMLILPDANGRSGLLTYGVPWVGTELGSNPNAVVSDSDRRMESVYEGLRYDYNLYNTRMDVFENTPWDGGVISYDDQGRGYQIFKHTGDVTLNYSGPTGTEKVILLINGNVAINSDIVVPDGAFLSIIAKGNITFGSSVTQAHGWFVGETISVPCHDGDNDGTCDKDDVQFVGEGSFVGWTNIVLGRDMDTGNNTLVTEKFVYRTDMFINVAEPMKVYTKKFSPFVP